MYGVPVLPSREYRFWQIDMYDLNLIMHALSPSYMASYIIL